MNEKNRKSSLWISLFALLVAGVAVAGSLGLSLLLGLLACPLCFYQRSFAMAAFGMLVAGLIGKGRKSGCINLLALYPALSGLMIAGLHCYLEATNQLWCPPGFYGFGSAPQQSLAAFVLLTLTLTIGVMIDMYNDDIDPFSMFVSVIVAAGLCYGASNANPPPAMPKPENMDKTCHPPVV
jgi:disulfide bond formation protein DsbB